MFNKNKSNLNSGNINSQTFSWFYEAGGSANISRKGDALRWNSIFIFEFVIIVGIVIFARIADLQIVNGAYYKNKSETNRYSEYKIRAPRGVIYDVNGIQLTNNAPSYRLMLNSSESDLDLNVLSEKIATILEKDASTIYSLIEEKKILGQVNILIARGISKDQFLLVNANIDELPGVYVEEDVERVYPYKEYASHVLGFTGESTQDDIDKLGYSSGDVLGKAGLEYQYEDLLKGKDGQQSVVIDVSGNVISEESTVEPVNGKNLKISIDIEVQKKLYELLNDGLIEFEATGAAAVLANIETGEILASVSLPSYDNNLFIGGIDYDEYEKLINDENHPMLNRVIGVAQPPGSTMKTITAIAGLDSKTITKNTIYNSTGVFYLGNYPFQEYHKKSYGPLNVVQALSKSSNIFFYETILEMGIDTLSDYANTLGIGSLTGIDIPGEISGNFSSPEYKSLITDEVWYPGDSLNAAIGQGYNRVSPIQMLRWISAIANGGTLINPHFLIEYEDFNGIWKNFEYNSTKLNINEDVFNTVREGMREGVVSGVVYTLRNASVSVAAKTGTAEFGVKNEDGEYTKAHAWITGFFPYDNPKYSFVFFQEAGGLGSESGKVANEFINWFVEYENSK